MFLRHTPTRDLVEVLSIEALINPNLAQVAGRFHAGEEMQEPAEFNKGELVFPSGEALPVCWTDPHYRS